MFAGFDCSRNQNISCRWFPGGARGGACCRQSRKGRSTPRGRGLPERRGLKQLKLTIEHGQGRLCVFVAFQWGSQAYRYYDGTAVLDRIRFVTTTIPFVIGDGVLSRLLPGYTMEVLAFLLDFLTKMAAATWVFCVAQFAVLSVLRPDVGACEDERRDGWTWALARMQKAIPKLEAGSQIGLRWGQNSG